MIHIVMIKVTSGRMEQDVALMLYRWRKLSTWRGIWSLNGGQLLGRLGMKEKNKSLLIILF